MKIVTGTRQEEENRSKSSRDNLNSHNAFALTKARGTKVRKSFGVHFDSALELVIRALTPWPNILKTVGLKS